MDEGIYLEVNEAFLDTTGYNKKEVIGKSSMDLGIWADPKQRDELHNLLKKNTERSVMQRCNLRKKRWLNNRRFMVCTQDTV